MVSFPKFIQIETTILCNAHCVFCPQNQLKRGPRYMEDWVWKKIIDESRGRGVTYRPFLVNEPFVDERLPEVLNYIHQDPTARVEINSNAHFLPKTDIPACIKAGIDHIYFSIDGFSQESYIQSGRGGRLSDVVDNVKYFLEERDRQNAKTSVEVRMISMPINQHEHEDFKKFWEPLADKVTITMLYNWPWTGQKSYHAAPCPKIRQEMFFYTDGQAGLCCWDGHGRSIVGDAKTQTVEEIWMGEINQQYRSWLDKGQRGKIKVCSKCDAFKTYDFSNWQGY